MIDKEKEIGGFFKEHLDNYRVSVPDDCFDKIMEKKPVKVYNLFHGKRKIFIGAVAAAAVLCSIFFYFINNDNIRITKDVSTIPATDAVDKTEIGTTAQTDTLIETDNNYYEATNRNEKLSVKTKPVAPEETKNIVQAVRQAAVVASPVVVADNVPTKAGAKSEEKKLSTQPAAKENKKTSVVTPPVVPQQDYEEEAVTNETGDEVQPSGKTENQSLLFVPSAFTPNSDGLNDFFMVSAVEELEQYRMMIYDLRGTMVFTSRSIQIGWDGEIAGSKAPNGPYVYIISYRDNTGRQHTEKGQLLLMR